MTAFGYKLMTEEHGPRALVENAQRAEDAGFDFVAMSDHFHPWLEEEGHAPFAWSVLGAVAQATSSVGIATGVTCPLMRYHPAIVAQAAATVAILSDNRFTLGLGSGERLNEHITGEHWPNVRARHERLIEAIEIIRKLWTGKECSHDGKHFTLESARLYDIPESPIDVVVAAGGAKAAKLAGEHGDGLMATNPDKDIVRAWRDAGGEGPVYGEIGLAYDKSNETALEIAHTYHRFSAVGWAAMTELPTPSAFAGATKSIKLADLAKSIPHGPGIAPIVEEVRAFIDAGFDHVALTAIGPDQAAFIDFFKRELGPALRSLK